MIGKIISHYKILEKIGEGGMGVVYKAEDTKLDRLVALKFLPKQFSINEEEKIRFIHEAKAAAALDHTNICSVYEIDETEDGQMFIVMGYYEGGTLKEKIEKGPLKIDLALDFAMQIAEGLNKAHQKDIIHRDIKSANIIVTRDGVAKILDFGLAKLKGQTKLTREGTTLGTVAYMSPEQTSGEDADNRSDIWSLGVVLYEMIAGQLPFKGEYDQAIMYAIMNNEPEPLTGLRTGVPMDLEKIINKALTKKPEERYQGTADLLVDLKTFIRKMTSGEPISNLKDKKPKSSIAVLPFANMSADPEQEYFCDGMAEEIINSLTHLKGLRVVARTSSFAFKGKEEDIRDIGKKLDVGHILEGSVRKAGKRLRITAQLIKVSDGYHVWSEKFDREMEDIFTIQDDISLAVVNKLKVNLLGDDRTVIIKRPTDDLEDYNLLLMGRYFYNRGTAEGLKKAIQYFEKVSEKNPDNASAYGGLAACYAILGVLDFLPPKSTFPKAKAAALKSIELDPMLPHAHSSLGLVKVYYDWDWDGAEKAIRFALELNPNYASAHSAYAVYFAALGKLDEAKAESEKAVELDPLSIVANANLGIHLLREGRLDQAEEQLRKTLELEPNYSMAWWLLGHVFVLGSEYNKGLETIQKALNLSKNNALILAGLGWAFAISGRKDEAQQIISELKKRAKKEYIRPYLFGKIHASLGEKEEAFKWLEKAYQDHDISLVYIIGDESLISLRDDSRFRELVKKMNLDPWYSEG